MDLFIKTGITIILSVLFYLIVKSVNYKDSKQEIFIKIRIFFGCIGVGVFLCQAWLAETIRTALPSILLSLLIFYGVVMSQKKYLSVNR